MNTNKGDALTQAFELIEAGKLNEAKAILKPVLDADKDNPDAWWLYAHAVQDSESARIALNNVLRLDSEYPEAEELLKTLEQQSPSERLLDSHKEPSFLPSAVPANVPDLPESDSFLDDFDTDDDDFDDDDEDEAEPFYRRPAFLIGILALLLIIAIVVVIVRPFGGTNTVDATATIQVIGDQPTLVPATVDANQATLPPATSLPEFPTELPLVQETVEPQSVDDLFAGVRSALAAFPLADNGIGISDTSLGSTLLVSVCTTAGRDMRLLLPQVMDALAKANESYSGQADAAAVRMMDCQANTKLLTIGMLVSDAAAYTSGSLSETQFEALWKPIR